MTQATHDPEATARPRRPVRVALVNDFEAPLRAVQAMLAPYADRVQVVDIEAGSNDVAPADIALFDTFGGKRHVLERVRDLVRRGSIGHVVVYTRDASPRFVEAAVQTGVSDVLLKTTVDEELVAALETVAAGRHPDTPVGRTPRLPASNVLDARDQELLAMLGLGLSNEQIAEEMFLGIETIRTHLRGLFRKLGVNNRTQAAMHAAELGLVPGHRAGDARVARRRTRRFQRVSSDVPVAREFVGSFLRAHGVAENAVAIFRLAISELAANVIEYGTAATWTLGIEAGAEWLAMDVTGGVAPPTNIVFHPELWMIAPPQEPTGRGLGIVRELMDQVHVDTSHGEVRVLCRLRP
jgi:DNA-binding NarL/FixJ family response regulator/anti-sigma regulatory factor (Ser/Thr protein kinase)